MVCSASVLDVVIWKERNKVMFEDDIFSGDRVKS